MSNDQERDIIQARVRERQWIYMGPILAAPVAHWAVTLYRDARTPQQKRLLLTVGVVGSTVATLTMRLYLMVHAGYPGASREGLQGRERTVTTLAEKERIENPSTAEIVKQAFRGFG